MVLARRKNAAPSRFRCNNDILLLSFLFVIFNLIWLNFRQFMPSVLVSTTIQLDLTPTLSRPDPPITSQRKSNTPDGTLNGHPVYYVSNTSSSSWHSASHCVGENYQAENSWMHRSCHYSLLCLDLEQQDFVVFEAPDEHNLDVDDSDSDSSQSSRPHMDVSQGYLLRNNTVSLGGINLKWTWRDDGIPRLKWAPRVVVGETLPASLYMLESNVVLIPFHSLSGSNPGHLVWDDFLPVYTLMNLFGLADDHHEPLMMRQVLQGGRGLWASCDFTNAKTAECQHMHNKFWPLMSPHHNHTQLTTNQAFDWKTTTSSTTNKSNYICARHGVAGIGALTDHGTEKLHGWSHWDYKRTHNHGRGGLFWDFRQYAMQNVGVVDQPLQPPYKIVYSLESSSRAGRNVKFDQHIAFLNSTLDPNEAVVETYVFRKHSLKEQMRIASEAAIFITGCGGGAVTGTFVQRGSSIFLYYASDGGVQNNRNTFKPARLDWDLFNNLGYARIHWMPRNSINKPEDLEALVLLVKNEISRLKLSQW
jgi:hypothetical protein